MIIFDSLLLHVPTHQKNIVNSLWRYSRAAIDPLLLSKQEFDMEKDGNRNGGFGKSFRAMP